MQGLFHTDCEAMWLSGLPLVISHRFKPLPLDEVGQVIIPGHAFTEKDGTVTNMEGRVQRNRKGIDATWVREDWRVFQKIANRLGASWSYDGVEEITHRLVRALTTYDPALKEGRRDLLAD